VEPIALYKGSSSVRDSLVSPRCALETNPDCQNPQCALILECKPLALACHMPALQRKSCNSDPQPPSKEGGDVRTFCFWETGEQHLDLVVLSTRSARKSNGGLRSRQERWPLVLKLPKRLHGNRSWAALSCRHVWLSILLLHWQWRHTKIACTKSRCTEIRCSKGMRTQSRCTKGRHTEDRGAMVTKTVRNDYARHESRLRQH